MKTDAAWKDSHSRHARHCRRGNRCRGRYPLPQEVLPNGLTLIVHEDHKAPIVAVNVWYHVGSKNERPGRTGFAHLFEHLMFNGSENYDEDFFEPLEQARRHRPERHHQRGPHQLLRERADQRARPRRSGSSPTAWGTCVGAITQAKLDEQRGVVQNEKRQGENEPYGKVWDFLTPKLLSRQPSVFLDHHRLDGRPRAAKLDDVKDWFQTYYGAANAVLVDRGRHRRRRRAKAKVEQYFGDIPPGRRWPGSERLDRQAHAAASGASCRTGSRRRASTAGTCPHWGDRGRATTSPAGRRAGTAASPRGSIKRLVYDDQIATDRPLGVVPLRDRGHTSRSRRPRGRASTCPRSRGRWTRSCDASCAAGPTAAELERVKTQCRAGFIRGIERIGGFGGKSDVLAEGEVLAGRPDFYKRELRRHRHGHARDCRRVPAAWLADGLLHAGGRCPTSDCQGRRDRRRPQRSCPTPGAAPPTASRRLSARRSPTDSRSCWRERRPSAQVGLHLLLDAGFAADPAGRPGTASLTMAMLDEGTAAADAIADQRRAGAARRQPRARPRLDASTRLPRR